MKEIKINSAVKEQIDKVTEASLYLWDREWAERNAGNISIDLTDIIGEIPTELDGFRSGTLDVFPKESAGRVYFVSGTGERLRELDIPENAGCILRINDSANGYNLLWGGRNRPNYRPTSEFISHVIILLDKKASGSAHICVIHTHPLELISLSHHPDFSRNEEAYNRACWQMIPEVRAFCPRGIGITEYTLPGSEALANLTVTSLRDKDVTIWEKHGAVAAGEDALEAFDYIDVANKGAKLFLQCLASGFIPEGLSTKQMDELADAFKLPGGRFKD